MLHLIYILAFTILAFLAVGNLIRNMMMLGIESTRSAPTPGRFSPNYRASRPRSVAHPELLDEYGNVVNEPYLVMRSMTVDDAREQLDALYRSSPSYGEEPQEGV